MKNERVKFLLTFSIFQSLIIVAVIFILIKNNEPQSNFMSFNKGLIHIHRGMEPEAPKQQNFEKGVMNMNSKPLIVIYLHSSIYTYERINKIIKLWGNHSLIRDGTIVIEVPIDRKIDDHNENFKQIVVGCNSERIFATCRFQHAYEEFLLNHYDTPWLFNGDDDIWIDIDNLYKYVKILMEIHNPMTELVFKGHANREKTKRYFLHGGCGWLISNCFLRFCQHNHINLVDYLPYSRYRQPDTSQSIVLRHIFKNISDWDEYHMQGFECKEFCPINSWISTNWLSLPICSSDEVHGRLKDVISFHTISLKDTNLKIAQMIKTAPDWVLFYRNNVLQSVELCRPGRNATRISDYSLKTLKMTEKIYKPENISVPIACLKELEDENYTGD